MPARGDRQRYTQQTRNQAANIITLKGISQLMLTDFTCFMEEAAEDMWFENENVLNSTIANFLKEYKENRLHRDEITPFLAACRILHFHPALLYSSEMREKWYERYGLNNLVGTVRKLEAMVASNQEFYSWLYTMEKLRDERRRSQHSFHCVSLN